MRCTALVLAGLALSFFVIFNCANPLSPDAPAVATDESELVITYAPGDSASSVTGNVVLPKSGKSGTTVTWVTSNTSRITIDGIVSRPAAASGDASVTLTAKIVKGKSSRKKTFILTVKDGSYAGNIMSAGSVTDIDGNIYQAVKIGTQVWTVENLRTTKYNDNTAIPFVTDSTAWLGLVTPSYCYFNNMVNADSIRKFGALYNWYAVDSKKLAPAGWHVPTDAEWVTLQNYLIANGYNWDATKDSNRVAKSLSAKTDWYTVGDLSAGSIGKDLTMNNKSGFLALPGGSRSTNGNSFAVGSSGNWWSATEYNASGAVARNLYYDYPDFQWNSNYKSCGFSVRLLRD